MHTEAPEAAYLPEEQLEHVDDEAAFTVPEKVPDGQFKQVDLVLLTA